MSGRATIRLILLILASLGILLFLKGCPSPHDSEPEDLPPEQVSATVTPDIRPLKEDSDIVIVFSKGIDTTSAVLGGDLAAESNGGLWSSTVEANDTLTISPTSQWTTGLARTLTLSASDSDGQAIDGVSLSYDVFHGTIYFVSSSASDDSGNGQSPAHAKATIKGAIDAASAPAVVVVNAGTYSVTSDTTGITTHVVLKEGVSLYGGYKSDFKDRNTQSYASVISDTSSRVTGSGTQPNRAIEVGTGLTTATRVDGFSINASSESGVDYSSAIFSSNGSATFSNNTINGGTVSTTSFTLYLSNGASSIESNTINGGSATSYSYGIYSYYDDTAISSNTISGGSAVNSNGIGNYGGEPSVEDNTINGGTGSTHSQAISNSSSTGALIRNNTLHGGTGDYAKGILNTQSNPFVESNTIYGGSRSSSLFSYGIYNDNLSTATIVKNNIHGGVADNATYGVYNNNSNAVILNNLIFGGTSYNTASFGVLTESGSSASIRNNTIHAGNGSTQVGVGSNQSAPLIDNNIIFAGSAYSYGIYEPSTGSTPAEVYNNNITGVGRVYLNQDSACTGNNDGDGNPNTCNIADLNGLAFASGNNEDAPGLADVDGADNDIDTIEDNNWHLSGSTASTVSTGGLNGIDEGWSFSDDKDSVTRPASPTPWAIGAYEP